MKMKNNSCTVRHKIREENYVRFCVPSHTGRDIYHRLFFYPYPIPNGIYETTRTVRHKIRVENLYDKAIQIARDKNADYVWLGVWEENPRAISFYKKNGFVEFDKHIFKFGNDEQTDIMMKLKLTSSE